MAYPKIQYLKSQLGYVQGVNPIAHPKEFDNAIWVKSSSGAGSAAPIVTPNAVASPLGDMTADSILFAPGVGGANYSNIGQTFASFVNPLLEPLNFSVWLRANSPVANLIYLSLRGLVNTDQAIPLITTDWQLYNITAPVDTNGVMIYCFNTAVTPLIHAWDAQLVSGVPMELLFKLPPINKPYVWQEAQRHDIFASGGEKQTTVERIDQFLAIEMPAIFGGDDADAWQDFLAWSIEGGEFQYFPDSDLDDSITCTVEETTAKLERKSYNVYSAKLTFRVAVP